MPRTISAEFTRVAGDQHLVVDRAVGVVAGRAAFLPDSSVLIDKRTGLLGVAADAGLSRSRESGATTADRVALVDIVAVHAAHLAGQDRVGVGQAHFAALFKMALEAGLRRLARIYDASGSASGLDVDAAGAVAGLASGVADLWVGAVQGKPAVG